MDRTRNRHSAIISAVIVAAFLLVPEMVLAGDVPCRSLTSSELAKLQEVIKIRQESGFTNLGDLSQSYDYSKFVAFVRDQHDMGGSAGYTALALLDVHLEAAYRYTPDASYFFNAYLVQTKKINPLEVIRQYGSAPEAIEWTNYDIAVPPTLSAPTPSTLNKAQRYKSIYS